MQNNSVPQKHTFRVELVKPRLLIGQARAIHSAPARSPRFELQSNIESELGRVRETWRSLQATRRRNAVFEYLTAVFDLIGRWRREGRLDRALQRAQMRQPNVRTRTDDPYTRLIVFTSDTSKTDAKTRSKWARALRWAEANKTKDETLVEFVRRSGGINKCAARWRGVEFNL